MSSHTERTKEAKDCILIESGRNYNGELHKMKVEGPFLIQPSETTNMPWKMRLGLMYEALRDIRPTNHGASHRPIRLQAAFSSCLAEEIIIG